MKKEILNAGTNYFDVWGQEEARFQNVRNLTEPIEMLVIRNPLFQRRLIALLETEASAGISIYTTGDTIQSSDYSGQNAAEKLAPGLSIAVPIGPLFYFLLRSKFTVCA